MSRTSLFKAPTRNPHREGMHARRCHRCESGPARAGEESQGLRCQTQEGHHKSYSANTSPDCSGKNCPEDARR